MSKNKGEAATAANQETTEEIEANAKKHAKNLEISQGAKTEPKERIVTIVKQVKGIVLERTFNLKALNDATAKAVQSGALLLLGESKNTITIEDNNVTLRLSVFGSSITLKQQLDGNYYYQDYIPSSWQKFTEALEKLLEPDIHLMDVRRFINKQLAAPPNHFDDTLLGFKISHRARLPKELEEDEQGKSEWKMARHIAEIIVAYSITEQRISKGTRESIISQFNNFVLNGRPCKADPAQINLTHPVFPEPIVALSDSGTELIWRFKKYFGCCGAIDINNCYCLPLEYKIEDGDRYADFNCWECYIGFVKRGMTQDYGPAENKDLCFGKMAEYLQYYEENITGGLPIQPGAKTKIKKWEKQHGEFYELDWEKDTYEGKTTYHPTAILKKLTPEQADKLIEKVNNFNMDSGDYEPPEDSCSCVTW
jgi:hypothetical protein